MCDCSLFDLRNRLRRSVMAIVGYCGCGETGDVSGSGKNWD